MTIPFVLLKLVLSVQWRVCGGTRKTVHLREAIKCKWLCLHNISILIVVHKHRTADDKHDWNVWYACAGTTPATENHLTLWVFICCALFERSYSHSCVILVWLIIIRNARAFFYWVAQGSQTRSRRTASDHAMQVQSLCLSSYSNPWLDVEEFFFRRHFH